VWDIARERGLKRYEQQDGFVHVQLLGMIGEIPDKDSDALFVLDTLPRDTNHPRSGFLVDQRSLYDALDQSKAEIGIRSSLDIRASGSGFAGVQYSQGCLALSERSVSVRVCWPNPEHRRDEGYSGK